MSPLAFAVLLCVLFPLGLYAVFMIMQAGTAFHDFDQSMEASQNDES